MKIENIFKFTLKKLISVPIGTYPVSFNENESEKFQLVLHSHASERYLKKSNLVTYKIKKKSNQKITKFFESSFK